MKNKNFLYISTKLIFYIHGSLGLFDLLELCEYLPLLFSSSVSFLLVFPGVFALGDFEYPEIQGISYIYTHGSFIDLRELCPVST